MVEQRWGRIICISSLAGRNGGVTVGPAYAASKAAVIGLTRHLAKKVARNGITVNAVAPGTTETDIIKGFSASEMLAINNTIPLGRLGKPEEIAETVAFLASDCAAFITGAVIDINGGMFIG
jgi:3-oxoacyl-[acyl-carrier protein] reductase